MLRAVLCLSVLVLAPIFLSSDRAYADKDLVVVGTVDCGRASGARCDIGMSIAIWTTDVSGYRERVVVDPSWILNQLDAYDQDDLIRLEVRLMPDGTLQAIGIAQPDTPQTTHDRNEDETDRKEAGPSLTPTPTGTASPTPTATSTPPLTNTATPVPSTTPTSTGTATSTLTPTPTATSTFSPTPTPTATSTFTPTATATPVLANLAVTKIDDSATRCGSDFACWTVTVTNAGPNPATNVGVQEAPSGFPFTEVTASAGTSFDDVTNVWNVGTLAVGASATLQLQASFVDGLQTNCAEVRTSDQLDPNSTPNNGNPAEDDRACSSRVNRL